MKKLKECPPESQNTINIANDALSLVFGKEVRGRVRGMGFGVTPSKVGAQIQQNGNYKQLQNEMHKLQTEWQEMRSLLLQTLMQQNQQEQAASGGVANGIGNEVVSGGDANGAKRSSDNADNINQYMATSQMNGTRGEIIENVKCKLLHWNGDGVVVAKGTISSIDPKVKVHRVPLGRSCWKVWIDEVLVENVDLIRPNEEMVTLEDAKGSTTSWLSKFIVLDD